MAKCWSKKTLLFILLASIIYYLLLVRAHVAYISNGTVVGLSKMNRIVDYFSKRPQVQERLTIQMVKELTRGFKNRRCSLCYRCKTFMC